MHLNITEEQNALARTALDFAQRHTPIAHMRALRDANDPQGYSSAVWQQMAELGWLGVHIPEAFDGVDLGFAELAILLESLGRSLTPEPLVPSLVLGGYSVLLGGSEALKEELLPRIADGSRVLTLAHQESPAIHDRFYCTTTATETDGRWVIDGKKVHVLQGGTTTDIVVIARISGDARDRDGLGLFLVSGDDAGLTRTPLQRLDSRNAAHLRFANTPAQAVLGTPGDAANLIDQVLDRGTIALCAEALGAMRQAFDISLEYLKERVQFGVPIGSFQALQHRAAKLFAEVELARSIVVAAARAVDQDPERVPLLAAAAKATCDETFLHIAHEGVQFHGGVGVTDEYDIGLYLKRARVFSATFGDAAWQRTRWATLKGY